MTILIEEVVLTKHMAYQFLERFVYRQKAAWYTHNNRLRNLKENLPRLLNQLPGNSLRYMNEYGSEIIIPTLVRIKDFEYCCKIRACVEVNTERSHATVYLRTVDSMNVDDIKNEFGCIDFSKPIILDSRKPPRTVRDHQVTRDRTGRPVMVSEKELKGLIKYLVATYPDIYYSIANY